MRIELLLPLLSCVWVAGCISHVISLEYAVDGGRVKFYVVFV